jgi:hypothetical protein
MEGLVHERALAISRNLPAQANSPTARRGAKLVVLRVDSLDQEHDFPLLRGQHTGDIH